MIKIEQVALGIGLTSQLLFSSRIVLQWVQSERAKRVLVPTLFWQISLISSFLMIIYGMLRHDPVILGAQLISYGIYIRNLQLLGEWRKLHGLFRLGAYVFPLATLAWFVVGNQHFSLQAMLSHSIPSGVLALGAIGQAIFLMRFVYQWLYSERKGESVLPLGFWLVSFVGSILILAYALLRRPIDVVLIVGNVFGTVVYARNIVLMRREEKSEEQIPEIQPTRPD
ncbi:lipid-A-disaccharide synthase N-terminal domain-containing protein [Hymenobacter sp. BT186]|uniref:Lipid-A-disaccharide synthase N-terminal domain-containing protein n=1 Tax=Hymenobacter telluris TaxID=2816474 RepID=A0A939F0S1_9BACT|nr:lipid-A-disaccharide synthase N-terminal domain-containing protein [Hymenobacter telluris]MBO0360202.1 lipid-A-disaccharide synthase N-terminal domain-containing protein [Hymenobacter telluris]MBW3376229.1 lipid-A-disaccharide synthase N-terminal domain-containing protein [Hymenobacter norwichensis]